MRRLLTTLAAFLALTGAAFGQAVIVPSPVPALTNNCTLKWQTATNTWVCETVTGDMGLASIQTVTGAKTFNTGTLILAGSTSGTTILNADATAGSTTIAFPAASGTVALTSVATLSSLTSVGTITTGGLGTGAVIGGVTMTLGTDAAYDLYYRGASGVLTRLANSTAGKVLTANTDAAPTWETSSGIAATDINTSAKLAAIVGDETGTGLLTFATSPAFLGVPTFGNGATSAGSFKILEDSDDGAHGVTFMVPSLAGDYTLTFPTTDGGANEVLTTDGSGNLSWTAAGGGQTPWTANVNAAGYTLFGSDAANGDLTLRGTSSATATTSYVLLGDATTAGVAVAGTAASGTFDVVSGSITKVGVVLGGDVTTIGSRTATRQYATIGFNSNTVGEEPIAFAFFDTFSDAYGLSIGGGASMMNTQPAINFFTAANFTTTTGSIRYVIDKAGKHWWAVPGTAFPIATNYEALSLTLAAGSATFAAETAGTGTDNVNIVLTPAGTGTVSTGAGFAAASFSVGATAGVDVTCGGPVVSATITKGIVTAMVCTSEPQPSPDQLLAEITALKQQMASLAGGVR